MRNDRILMIKSVLMIVLKTKLRFLFEKVLEQLTAKSMQPQSQTATVSFFY